MICNKCIKLLNNQLSQQFSFKPFSSSPYFHGACLRTISTLYYSPSKTQVCLLSLNLPFSEQWKVHKNGIIEYTFFCNWLSLNNTILERVFWDISMLLHVSVFFYFNTVFYFMDTSHYICAFTTWRALFYSLGHYE